MFNKRKKKNIPMDVFSKRVMNDTLHSLLTSMRIQLPRDYKGKKVNEVEKANGNKIQSR